MARQKIFTELISILYCARIAQLTLVNGIEFSIWVFNLLEIECQTIE